jgi:TolB protein
MRERLQAILDHDSFPLYVAMILALLLVIFFIIFRPNLPPGDRLPGEHAFGIRWPKILRATQSGPAVENKTLVTIASPEPLQTKVVPTPISQALIPATATVVSTPAPTPPGGGILHKIAFTSNRENGRHYHLFMMDANGLNLEQLTEGSAFDRDPHLAYDGKRIAFSSNESGVYQIYILDLETRAIRQVSTGKADKTNPFWSPDQNYILYTVHEKDTSEVAIMNADGSQPRVLTRNRGNRHAYGFSPDGKWISYESTESDRNEIFIFDLQKLEPRRLIDTDQTSHLGDPVFSPKGRFMLFISSLTPKDMHQIYLYDLELSDYRPLTKDSLDKDDPIFSPDGSMIAYIANWRGAWNIFTMNRDGSDVKNLTQSYHDHLVPSWR